MIDVLGWDGLGPGGGGEETPVCVPFVGWCCGRCRCRILVDTGFSVDFGGQ